MTGAQLAEIQIFFTLEWWKSYDRKKISQEKNPFSSALFFKTTTNKPLDDISISTKNVFLRNSPLESNGIDVFSLFR